MSGSYIRNELFRLIEEKELLQKWSADTLTSIIQDVGFSCVLCGKCCTSGFNGHVFLLDNDVSRVIESHPEYLIPAPEFELMDNDGSFYVSGYALRVNDNGSCPYLHQNRCRIYAERFSICRIYPYMLHREPDKRKKLEFRQISGLNKHGEYHCVISYEDALHAAQETIVYETAWLDQMISFYTAVEDIFSKNNFSFIRKSYDHRMQEFRKGNPVVVYVWYKGNFIKTNVRCDEYHGFGWP